MAKMAMHKLALLGAKHLLKGGHISKATHGRMRKSVKAKALELEAPPPEEFTEQPLQFGSLDPGLIAPTAPALPQAPLDAPVGMLGGLPPLR